MRTMLRRGPLWVGLVAGAWLFVSPWVLGYTAATAGTWAAYILGALAVLGAFWGLTAHEPGYVLAVEAVIGALAFVTPWVVGFQGHAAARLDAWIVGAVLVVASMGSLLEGYARRERRRAKPAP